MNKLILVQHIAPSPMGYKGFTVKPGMFYGVVKTPFGNIPAAWSGWTCERFIALYTLIDGAWSMRWIDDDEVASWCVLSYAPTWDSVPFFAE